jgi:hypothetical protein
MFEGGRFPHMNTAYIMKAAECVAAAEKISDRAERAALLKVAGSYLLAPEVAGRPDEGSQLDQQVVRSDSQAAAESQAR